MLERGILKLWVQRRGGSWGLLETFPFDNALRWRRDHRKAKLDRALTSLFTWQENYWQYNHASFCLEEQENESSRVYHLFGSPRKLKGGGMKRRRTWQQIKAAEQQRKQRKDKPKCRNVNTSHSAKTANCNPTSRMRQVSRSAELTAH